ncbi:hypothetical protein IFT84_02835 [Rhizobium sp. CFBP 8762]|uniref:hypothetical protein n=1 Tax=Rhizobium sp. CFBP 8762 TaxID=2775279 RepID=UPI00177C3C2A|nr:hypothetical protein [Rhizobium sp. CFBP 8762]MBD8553456.1 hypothetical protein [Rhizobium sp. CFBP 8762]
MTAPISRYLKDFSAPRASFSSPSPKFFADFDTDISTRDAPPVQPRIDIDLERATAFSRGREAAIAELDAQHAQHIADLKAAHALEMEALRATCEQDIAAMIFERFNEASKMIVTAVSDQTARALLPVLDGVLVEKTLADLAATVQQGLEAGEIVTITISGPKSLFDALKTKLATGNLAFRHVETDDADVSVEFGDTIMVTRLAAWAETLEKALA